MSTATGQFTPTAKSDSRYALVARAARELLVSGRESYLYDAIAEAFVLAPVEGVKHPSITDFRAAAELI